MIFILSPARTDGKRGDLLFNPKACFPLAIKLRDGTAPLWEIFSFLSGLYFRGKVAYAKRFAQSTDDIWIITPTLGLVPFSTLVSLKVLTEFRNAPIFLDEPSYYRPLKHTASLLDSKTNRQEETLLLGSIATDKYAGVLLRIFQDRLIFPREFLGAGDMKRGSLMLNAAKSGQPLNYNRASTLQFSRGRLVRASSTVDVKCDTQSDTH